MLYKRFFSFFCLVIALAFMFSVLPGGEIASAQTSGGNCPPYNPVLAKDPGWLKSLPKECQKEYEALQRSREKSEVAGQALSPGPDDYGYTSEAVTYSWVTAATPSGLTGDDADTYFNLGFTFPFYENSYGYVYINTNGILTFGNRSYGYPYGAVIPDSSTPNNFVAPFWEDLTVGAPYNSGAIYYSQGGSAPNRYLVVEWRNVTYYWDTSTPFSFETILYENGNIVIQYKSVPSNYYTTAVGIENIDGTDGLQYHYMSDTGLSTSTAIRFNYPTTPTARVKVTPLTLGAFSATSGTNAFVFSVKNIGSNGTDTFDFVGTSPWSLTLRNYNGFWLLSDTDADGYIDTGPIVQGGVLAVYAEFSPPGGATMGDYMNWGMTVRSSLNTSTSKVVTFQLSIPTNFVSVRKGPGFAGLLFANPSGVTQSFEGTGDYSAIARTPSGSFLYTWAQADNNGSGKYWENIQYAIVGSDGSQIRSPGNLINNSGNSLEVYDYEPAVAAAPNSMMGITWLREIYNRGTNKSNLNILFAALDPSGNLAYGPVSVTNNNSWGNWGVNFFNVHSPTIAATSDNRFALGWTRETHPDQSTYNDNLWYAIYTTSAGVVRSATAFTTDNTSWSPVFNTLRNGNAILTWNTWQSSSLQYVQNFLVINSGGGVVKGATALSNDTNQPWSNSDAVALPDGKVAVGWISYDGSDETGITFDILDESFNVVAGPTTVSAIHPGLIGDQYLSMTTDYLSQVIFTWGDEKGRALFYALGDSTGTFLTPPAAYVTDPEDNMLVPSYNGQGSAPWPTDFVSNWYGGAVVTADQNVVTVGRPHIGSEVASYDGFSSGSTTQYVPMLFKQMWGSYDSALYIQNTDTSNTANVTIKFYDPNGVLNCTKTDSIPKLSSHGYWLPSETCLPANWYGGVVVTANRNVVAVGRPHIGNQVMTYNGFASGSLTQYVPMLFKQMWGYDSAFYVQNTDDTNDANITIDYYDPAGTLNCETTDTIPKLSSHGYWLPSESCLPDSWYGGVVVTSDKNIVAVGRPHLGSEVTTYNGFPGGSTTMYAPMLFKGTYGSYDSALYIQNVDSTNTATIAIKFYDSGGTLSCTKDDTILPGSSKGYWLPSETCLSAGWVGSVKVESDYPVVVIGRPHLGSSVTAYDGIGSGGTSASAPMLFKQMWGSYDSALYVENTDPSNTADVTTAFYDVNGNLSCVKEDTIGPLATKSYWLPSLTCSP